MNLAEIIDVNKDSIVTVVGAGGKTSLINYLANYYKDSYSILLTTTTKIFPPKEKFYDSLLMLKDKYKVITPKKNGVVVCGSHINNEEKIVGLEFNDLDKLIPKFDLVLIEGDGSKMKKIKGWRNNEPVVHPKTLKVIGVLDITAYDMDINEENIHRLEELKKITPINQNRKITIENLYDIVLSENGIFKNSIGEKMLFINKVESDYYEELAKNLIENITNTNSNINIVYGSIKKGILKRGL